MPNTTKCYYCGGLLGEFDNPPFGPPRHFICPDMQEEVDQENPPNPPLL